MNKILSKTSYLQGLKCSKFMWLNKYLNNHMEPISTGDLSRIETGKKIGELARQQYLNGYLVPDSIFDVKERVKITNNLIAQGVETIFEATFSYNDVEVRVDILKQTDKGYEIYEVKNKKWTKKITKGQKEIKGFINDVAIQYYVLNGLGISINDSYLTCLDGEYRLDEEIEVNKIFKNIIVTDEVLAIQNSIPKNIDLFKNTLGQTHEPAFEICSGCSDCSFKKYCWKDMPDFSVFSLLSISKKAFELYDDGIIAVEDIPQDYEFTREPLKIIRDCWKDKKDLYINNEKVNEALSKLKYPLYHLDFETFTPTLPIYNNTSPSQVIPFQYSLHIEHEDNTIEHKEYLAQNPLIDPREELIVRLLNDIKGDSSIVVYSTYEATTLKNLADEFPEYSEELLSIRSRLWDLAEIFNKRYINFYQLKNKYSLKYVMPILVPKMSNKYLELKENGHVSYGEEASNAFLELMTEKDSDTLKTIREELLKYCKLDTESMVESLRAVKVLNTGVSGN